MSTETTRITLTVWKDILDEILEHEERLNVSSKRRTDIIQSALTVYLARLKSCKTKQEATSAHHKLSNQILQMLFQSHNPHTTDTHDCG